MKLLGYFIIPIGMIIIARQFFFRKEPVPNYQVNYYFLFVCFDVLGLLVGSFSG